MCQPTVPAVYWTPALSGITAPVLVIVCRGQVMPLNFAGNARATGTVKTALQGAPHCERYEIPSKTHPHLISSCMLRIAPKHPPLHLAKHSGRVCSQASLYNVFDLVATCAASLPGGLHARRLGQGVVCHVSSIAASKGFPWGF